MRRFNGNTASLQNRLTLTSTQLSMGMKTHLYSSKLSVGIGGEKMGDNKHGSRDNHAVEVGVHHIKSAFVTAKVLACNTRLCSA